MSSSPDGGSQFRSSQTTQNLNTSVHHNTNNINNNSHNAENYNGASNKPVSGRCEENQGNHSHHKTQLGLTDNEHALSQKSLTNASHFSAGSGVLSDTPPPRPARRQYINKSKWKMHLLMSYYLN